MTRNIRGLQAQTRRNKHELSVFGTGGSSVHNLARGSGGLLLPTVQVVLHQLSRRRELTPASCW